MLRAALEGEAFDTVIVDHLMPGRDGFDFATDVSADTRLAGLPILMLTSAAAASGRLTAREVVIGAYLAKPASRAQLIRALGAMLGHSPWDQAERRLVTNETLDRDYSSLKILLAEDNA
jgi:DNA-binding response OmpR family regulator